MKNKSLCFILILLLLAPAGGFSETAETAVKPPAAKRRYPPMSMLAVPETLGKIDTRFKGTSKRWIINIQDVHAHLAAQENISAIVDQLSSVYGIRTIALEGGWNSTTFPKSWSLPNSREKQMVARKLLEDGYLTGPPYSALFSVQPLRLVGIEKPELYEKNRKTYLDYIARHDEIQAQISDLENKLTLKKAQTYNPDLLSLDTALVDYREGRKPEKFLPMLLSKTEEHSVDLSDLGQVMLFKKILAQEMLLDKEKLNGEAERLVKAYKKKHLNFEELLRSGKIPPADLDYYPQLRQYLELIKLQDQLVMNDFFPQIEEAIKRLKEKLFASEEERALDARFERFVIAKRIMSFKATPTDLELYTAQQDLLVEEMIRAGLKEALRLGVEFYRLAKRRDKIFFDRLMKDPKLKGNIAVVTGGFHTEGLTEQFQKAGVSYIVITPGLGEEPQDEALYFKRLAIGPSVVPLVQNLSPFIDSLEQGFDDRFPKAVEMAKGRDLIAAAAVAEGNAQAEEGTARSADQMNAEDFLKLSEEAQLAKVKEWIDAGPQGDIAMGFVAEAPDLTEIFNSADLGTQAKWFWQNGLTKADKVTVTFREFGEITDLPETVVQIKTQKADLMQLIAQPSFQDRHREILDQNLLAVMLPEGAEPPNNRFIKLPVHPASLLFRYFLTRVKFENNKASANFLDAFLKAVNELGFFKQFQQSA